MSAVLGVDPGVSGGIAVLGRNGAVLYCKGVRGDMTEKALSNMVGDAAEVLRAAGGGHDDQGVGDDELTQEGRPPRVRASALRASRTPR